MSARPDIRQLPGAGSAGHPGSNPGAAPAHNPAYFSRHPPLNARHAPSNYLVDAAAAAAAAGKSMRTTPQPAVSGVPVSLGGLTIGRSSSPAARPGGPSAAYQASGLGQRVLPSADHAGQVRYHLPIHAAANSAGPFAGIRDPATAYLRGNTERHSDRGLGHPPHTTAPGPSPAAVAASGRLTLSRHPNQPIYNHYQDMQPERGYHSRPTSTAASTTSTSWSSMTPGGQQFPQLSLCTPASGQPKPSDFLGSNHPTVVRGHKTASVAAASSLSLPHTSKSNAAAAVLQQSDPAYLREVGAVAHIHPGLQNFHATSLANNPAAVAMNAANAAAAIAAAEVAHKRPRLDLSHPPGPVAGSSTAASNSISQPLRIDTRETVKESCYQPPVEAISPTGPEAPGDQMDDLKAVKDELLTKITKVDREIAKTESQIAKLKKKYQEQEEHANKPLSDSNEDTVEEKPKNQSIAQVIYAENRKKAKLSHEMLDKYAVNELPLYNQPSDTSLYHENKRNHAIFKKVLVDHFRRKIDDKEARERYITDSYTKLSNVWLKKAERVENSRKRKERDAKARELYEKIFPELRKQREDKERDHRLGTRGAVRSEADIEDVIERLQEQEMEDKKMHSLAVIPPLLLPPEERKRKFTNNNGLILDPLREYSERKFVNTWTDPEREIFKEKFLLHPKNFGLIAQSLERKTVSDCVQYYYLSKKTENYKQLLRKSKMGRGRRRQPNNSTNASANASQPASEAIIGSAAGGVLTRNRNKNENENSRDGFDNSNRSTPQPGIKQEPKEEKEDDDKKGGKGKDHRNDSSDEEDSPQSVKSAPHQCNVCKVLVENSRPVTTKTLASLLGLSDSDIGSDTRVCNACFMKAQRKKGNNNCPIPACTATKGRVKGRLRHMPSKLKDLPKDAREALNNEFHISDNTKKCCSACFTRLTRKIAQLTDGSPPVSIKTESVEPVNSVSWSEEEIEMLRSCLKASGRNWAVISQKLNGAKTTEQCKKFFYNNRKKHQLDKLVTEFKRSTATGDQPPTLSSDEESGSSTDSCEDGPGNSATPSGNSSPVPKNKIIAENNTNAVSAPTSAGPGKSTTNNVDMKPPIKIEDVVKSEVKTEAVETSNNVPTAPINSSTGAIGQVAPKKEEEYDSSATMSADERESDSNQPRVAYMQQQQQQQAYIPSGISRETSVTTRPPFPGAPPAPPPVSVPGQIAVRQHGLPLQPGQAGIRPPMTTLSGSMPRPPFVPSSNMVGQAVPPGAPPGTSVAQVPPPGSTVASGAPNSKDTITVKELMINVIEKSLSNPFQAVAGNAGPPGTTASGHPSQPPPSPTIQNLLDSSSKPPNKTNFVREKVGLNPLSRVGTMAPPAAPPPSSVSSVPTSSPSVSGASGSSTSAAGAPGSDCETLDLSMPRRRESAATPPSHFSQVRDPTLLHRRSPFNASGTTAASATPEARPAPPPPAHSNKVKTDPYLREISPSSFDGGRSTLTTPPHHMGRASPSPGPARPPSSNSRLPPPPQPTSYIGRSGGLPPTTVSAGRQPALSPKMHTSKPGALTIQTGSITQGTPAIQQRYGEPLLAKMTPPEPRQAGGGGSITQGTPCYDKNNMRRENAYYPPGSRAGVAPGGAGGPPVSTAYPEQHLSTRHVIMTDFAMARSTEMPRRVDSRDNRAISPATSAAAGANNRSGLRDLSPRPRTGVDPRVAAAAASQIARDSGGRPVSTDPRRDPLYIAAAALAEQQSRNISGLPEPRGDPKADMGPSARGDPRASMPSRSQQQAQQQAQHPGPAPPAATLSRNYFMGSNTSQASQAAGHSQQVYLTSDGRYSTSSSRISRSPPRSTPPPARPNMAMPRQGGITSGKPIVTKELYRGAPEVTISKTSSPRGMPYVSEVPNNALASLVDVAVQQPKIDLSQIRTHQQAQAAALMAQAMASNPKAASSLAAAASASTSTSQLVQQVQAERNKQQYFLVNEAQAAAAAAAAGSYSSAARITAATSKQPPSASPSGLSRQDAPAVIISERDRQTQMAAAMKMLTAQNIIDAVITQSIQGGSGPDGLKTTEELELVKATLAAKAQHEKLEEMKAAAVAAQHAAVVSAASQPQQSRQSQIHELQVAQAQAQAHAQAQAQLQSNKPNLPADMMLNRELSITPAPPTTSNEDYMKKRQMLITTSATLTPTSSASAPTRVSDERQIIRVAQPVSPATSAAAISSKLHGGLEISAAPGSLSVLPQPMTSVQQGPTSAQAVVDMKKKAAAAQAAALHAAHIERLEQTSGSPNGEGQSGVPGIPGISPLDYVKSKIVEEMKKHGEDGTPLVPGQKRASPPLQPGEDSAAKKGKPEVGDQTGNAGSSAAGAGHPPESPGSPGDMVIDESSETTPKASSPANATASTPVSEASASAGQTGSGNANSNANTSKYEPLSDDE